MDYRIIAWQSRCGLGLGQGGRFDDSAVNHPRRDKTSKKVRSTEEHAFVRQPSVQRDKYVEADPIHRAQ